MIFRLKNKEDAFIANAKYLGSGENSHKNNETVILPGSFMSKTVKKTKKWNECSWIDASRRAIVDEGYVKDYDKDYFQFVKPYQFSSPNRAACSVLGYITTKAWDEFVNDEGHSMRTIYKS